MGDEDGCREEEDVCQFVAFTLASRRFWVPSSTTQSMNKGISYVTLVRVVNCRDKGLKTALHQ